MLAARLFGSALFDVDAGCGLSTGQGCCARRGVRGGRGGRRCRLVDARSAAGCRSRQGHRAVASRLRRWRMAAAEIAETTGRMPLSTVSVCPAPQRGAGRAAAWIGRRALRYRALMAGLRDRANIDGWTRRSAASSAGAATWRDGMRARSYRLFRRRMSATSTASAGPCRTSPVGAVRSSCSPTPRSSVRRDSPSIAVGEARDGPSPARRRAAARGHRPLLFACAGELRRRRAARSARLRRGTFKPRAAAMSDGEARIACIRHECLHDGPTLRPSRSRRRRRFAPLTAGSGTATIVADTQHAVSDARSANQPAWSYSEASRAAYCCS